jgi:hypothetical protein
MLLDFDIEADANREPLAARLSKVCTEFLYDNLLPRNIAAWNSDQTNSGTDGTDPNSARTYRMPNFCPPEPTDAMRIQTATLPLD